MPKSRGELRPPSTAPGRASAGEESRVVFDAPEAALLIGKPAKGTGKIQAVLKSVASAIDRPPDSGPLVAGLEHDSWVIAATYDDPGIAQRLAQLLHWAGIDSRIRRYGTQDAVEVAAMDRREAERVWRRNREWLREIREPTTSLRALHMGRLLLLLGVLGPQIAFLLVAAGALVASWLSRDELNMAAFWQFFGRAWGASVVASLVVFLPLAPYYSHLARRAE